MLLKINKGPRDGRGKLTFQCTQQLPLVLAEETLAVMPGGLRGRRKNG